jgi:hypothetical protein
MLRCCSSSGSVPAPISPAFRRSWVWFNVSAGAGEGDTGRWSGGWGVNIATTTVAGRVLKHSVGKCEGAALVRLAVTSLPGGHHIIQPQPLFSEPLSETCVVNMGIEEGTTMHISWKRTHTPPTQT